jgi:hypothetical protein
VSTGLALTLVLAAACASGPPESDWQRICEDINSGLRVDDDNCDDDGDGSGGRYVYYPTGKASAPAMGAKAGPGGVHGKPSGTVVTAPSSGGFGLAGGGSGS